MGEFVLVTPNVLPSGTRVASSMSELYTVTTTPNKLLEWNVGTPTGQNVLLQIYNNSVSHDLRVTVTVPSFLVLENRTYILAPTAGVGLVLYMNAGVAETLAGTNVSGTVAVDAELVDTNGPVLVRV